MYHCCVRIHMRPTYALASIRSTTRIDYFGCSTIQFSHFHMLRRPCISALNSISCLASHPPPVSLANNDLFSTYILPNYVAWFFSVSSPISAASLNLFISVCRTCFLWLNEAPGRNDMVAICRFIKSKTSGIWFDYSICWPEKPISFR